jgi:hypothetical protein
VPAAEALLRNRVNWRRITLIVIGCLLQLMDTDKNGKVSKAEFPHFMEQEKELRYLQYKLSHPAKGPGR